MQFERFDLNLDLKIKTLQNQLLSCRGFVYAIHLGHAQAFALHTVLLT